MWPCGVTMCGEAEVADVVASCTQLAGRRLDY